MKEIITQRDTTFTCMRKYQQQIIISSTSKGEQNNNTIILSYLQMQLDLYKRHLDLTIRNRTLTCY